MLNNPDPKPEQLYQLTDIYTRPRVLKHPLYFVEFEDRTKILADNAVATAVATEGHYQYDITSTTDTIKKYTI